MVNIPNRDKDEFRYRYRKEFTKLLSVRRSSWYPKMRDSPIKLLIKYLAKRARIELGYSERTGSTDILHLLTNKLY